jgi:hypothetical protein
MNSDQHWQDVPWLHLRCGQRVTMHDDERHVGVIEAISNSVTARVRWDNGWLSVEDTPDLRALRCGDCGWKLPRRFCPHCQGESAR